MNDLAQRLDDRVAEATAAREAIDAAHGRDLDRLQSVTGSSTPGEYDQAADAHRRSGQELAAAELREGEARLASALAKLRPLVTEVRRLNDEAAAVLTAAGPFAVRAAERSGCQALLATFPLIDSALTNGWARAEALFARMVGQ